MSFRRSRPLSRGPTPIFKRRLVRFAATVANSVPTRVGILSINETSTIYAVKIHLNCDAPGGSGGTLMETDFGILVERQGLPATELPDGR